MFPENINCYATHPNDVAKISIPFPSRLKLDAKLQTQRPTEVLIQYMEKTECFIG